MAEETSKGITPTPARRINPVTFFAEVRREASKVTWPSWKETYLTTIMVFIMVALSSIFFFAADMIIRYLITFLLGVH